MCECATTKSQMDTFMLSKYTFKLTMFVTENDY